MKQHPSLKAIPTLELKCPDISSGWVQQHSETSQHQGVVP
jgi:hypothetical protein